MVKRIGRDVFGELLETGKAAAKQITGGSSKSGFKPSGGIKDLLPQEVGNKQMMELKQKDAVESQKELDKTRFRLAQMKIRRYQNLQRKILEEEKKKEQEIPAYEAGKPGAPGTLEEKKEMIGEQREKKEEEKMKTITPPQSKQSRGMSVTARVKQKQGSKEIGRKRTG